MIGEIKVLLIIIIVIKRVFPKIKNSISTIIMDSTIKTKISLIRKIKKVISLGVIVIQKIMKKKITSIGTVEIK